MSRDAVDISVAEVPVSRFDTVIEWLMIALLAFMPLAFGAVEAWSEFVVITLAGALAICFALKLIFQRGAPLVWTWAYVPIVLFLAVAVLQLLPLPAAWAAALSPQTASLKTELLGDLPNADSLLKTMTLTFYPLATAYDLRLVLAAAVVFVIVLNVYRRADQITRLLGAIAVIGGTIALLALAQDLFGNGMIYWVVPTGFGQANAGTFINHSHYGQFMNLSIGAAMGLLLIKLHEGFTDREITLPGVITRLGEPELRVVWYLAGMIVLGAATIFVSLTRGGMIALLIAGAFATLMLASKRALKGRGWIMMLMALGAFICVLYVGFDAVYDRLATLHQIDRAEGGRWQIVKDVALAWTRFPLLGTGLGTHEVVYPMFDRSTIPALAAHAENEYAQVAEEMGVVGIASILVFLAIAWWNYARCVRRTYFAVRSAAFGLGVGLLAIMIQSLSDFGQHLPANACLTAVTCGLLVSIGQSRKKENAKRSWLASVTSSRPLRAAAAVFVMAVWAWSLLGANAARSAEAAWNDALRVEDRLRKQNWLGSNEEYAALLQSAMAAAEDEPGNVKYRHWLNAYRWHSISRVRDPGTGNVVLTPEALGFARRIVDDLHQARVLCPTFGPTYCVAGQIEKFVLNLPVGAEHIRTGYVLAPCDPTASFVAGFLDAAEGQPEASLAKFRRSLELNGNFLPEIVSLYVHQTRRPDLAVAIAGDNVGWLFRIADMLQNETDYRDLAAKTRARAVALLQTDCERPDAPAWAVASMAGRYLQEKDYEGAVKYYRRALALDYGQVDWRFSLAQALAESGRVAEAMHEARICLRLRPQMTVAERLIADLSVHPDAMSEK